MSTITATPDQAPLFDMADAGVPLLMERDGKKYYVVAESQLEAFVSFIAPRIRRQLNAVPITPFPGFISLSGDAIRRIG